MKKKSTEKEKIHSLSKKLFDLMRISLVLIGLVIFSSTTSYAIQEESPAKIQQGNIITGKVLNELGEALPGVNIIKKGTAEGTITDLDGSFSISASSDDVLEFSFIGFVTQSLRVGEQAYMEIVLLQDATQIEEVVVVGYGTVRKKDLTGSVGSVGGNMLESRGSADAVEALQGQLPGVNITRSSGRSDVSFDMVIRGQNSIAGGSPLYVVDGLVVENIEFLNPNDISQIDILKDASSTAVYGSRGSNGVVIIKTKSGESSNEKISISYDGYYGVRTPAHLPAMMDAEQWLNYRIASQQGNSTEPFSGDVFGGTSQVKAVTGEEWDREIQRRIDAGETYSWPDKFMENGGRQNHYISLQGNTGKTSFNMSAGYQNENGFIEKDFMNKYTFSLNLRHQFNDQWEVGGQFRTGFKETEIAGEKSILNLYRMPPIALASDPTGWLWEEEGLTLYPSRMTTGAINPLLDQKYANTNEKSIDLLGKIFFKYQPVKWLTLRTDFLPRYSNLRGGEWRGLYSENAKGVQSNTSASARTRNRLNFTWDNQINVEKSFNKHTLKGTGLFSIYDFEEEDFLYEVLDLPQNTSFYNLGAANVRNLSESEYTMNRLVSYMLRFNYDYDGRYLLTLSNRWDGSSKLGEGHKWASFPSAALAWRIIEEPFMGDVDFISNLKMRLSYGFTGNNNISAYQSSVNANYLYNYDFNGDIANGIGPSGIANRALTWERTGELNFGLDFGFFNNRVSGTVDLYTRTSRDLLLNRKLPVPMGWDEMIDNIGSVKNEGIEASLRTINVQSKNWTWETYFVFTKNNNSVVETNLGEVDDVVNGLFIGEPINVHYNYEFIGIWQLDETDEAASWGREPGMPKIKDVSGPEGVPDGKIDAQYDRVIIGKPTPDWTGSFYTKLRYKDFDLSATVYTEQGSMKQSSFFNDLIYTSRNTVVYNYWTVTNPSNDAPNPAFLDDIYWGRKGAQLQNFRNTSYTRVQNITFGYTLPREIAQRINMQKLRIYTNVTNPVLITPFEGHDPEFGDKGANDGPSFITYQLGVNVIF